MKRSTAFILTTIASVLIACNGASTESSSVNKSAMNESSAESASQPEVHDYLTTGSKGIGPVQSFMQPTFDQTVADNGNKLFIVKCTMCHELKEDKLGPALHGITKKRRPEWILNLMLNPDEMFEKDADAIALKDKYDAVMVNMGLSEDEAKSILEYLRQEDAK